MRLRDKVAIITGGGHGLGKAYALRFAEEGAAVAIAEIDEAAARSVATEIQQKGGHAIAIPTDVTSEESTLEMARRTAEELGGIDILVNNAAIFATIPITRAGFDQISLEEWERTMAVNVKGPWLCARAVVPYMKQRGGGKIINVASGLALDPNPGRIHYVASKAAVLGITKTLARELGEFNICVNTLAPGSTLTEADDANMQQYRQKAVANRAIKRVQTADDLAGSVVFLASDDANFITGHTLVVDGGQIMH